MIPRNTMLGRLHQLKKTIGLDDDTYRDKLEALTGKRSAAELTDGELSLCLNNFHVKQSSVHLPPHAKIKALFIAAYNLGALDDGSDAALDSFAMRQTGKQRLTFVAPSEASLVTEALKSILTRHGFVVPASDPDGMAARRELLKAQWARLRALEAVRVGDVRALESWCEKQGHMHCHAALINMKRQELDAAARDLGRWLRRTLAKKAKAA